MASSDQILSSRFGPRPAPLLGPTTASSVLVGAAAVAALLDAWTAWNHHGVAGEYTAGTPGVGVADLTSAESASRTAGALYLITLAAAAIALLVWLSRTRTNARLAGRPDRPTARVVAVSGWFPVSLAAIVLTVGMTVIQFGGPTVDDLARMATVDTAAAVVQFVTAAAVIVLLRRRPEAG